MTNLVADWTNFALLTGGAAGAMVGLLFVAVSIRADAISQSRAVSSRISQVLTIFLGLLSASLMVSLPDLSNVALGVLLIVAAVCMGGYVGGPGSPCAWLRCSHGTAGEGP